jgi:hypothetical protein
MKRKTARLRWGKPFWPDWKTGFGKGNPACIMGGAELELTEKGKNNRHRWRVIGTNFQSFLDEIDLEP